MTPVGQARHNRYSGLQRARLDGPLQALQLIETVQEAEPSSIVLVVQRLGSAASPEEVMAARVKWATKARYAVLTRDVPKQFAPYNAVIRVLGTEDRRADYLAMLIDQGPDDS